MADELITTQGAQTPLRPADMIIGQSIADLCREIVLKTGVDIKGNNEKFLKVEGWESIAAADQKTPSADELQFFEHGILAKSTLRRDSDGTILSTAFGYCGFAEDPEADLYAVIGKAQTRAISRVCRHKYSYVLVLIDPSIKPTPSEEVPAGGFMRALSNARKVFGATSPERGEQRQSETTGIIERIQYDQKGGGFWSFFCNKKYFWTTDRSIGPKLDKFGEREVLITSEKHLGKTGKTSNKVLKVEELLPLSATQEQKENDSGLETESTPGDDVPY